MRANALKSWWSEGKGVARIMHPLENGFALYRWGSGLYNFIQRKLPLSTTSISTFWNMHQFIGELAELLLPPGNFPVKFEFSPDLVLNVHAHLNHGYFQLARDAIPHKRSKFVIFCGELADGQGFSRHWINPDADLFTGPFEETCQAAKKRDAGRKDSCYGSTAEKALLPIERATGTR